MTGAFVTLVAVVGWVVARVRGLRGAHRARARLVDLAALTAGPPPALGPAESSSRTPSPLARLVAATTDWRARRRDEAAAVGTLPDTVDLLAVAARSGLPVRSAILAVASRAPPPWAEPLATVAERCRRGEAVVGALEALAVMGDPARALVTVLRDAALDGGDLHRDLVRVARDSRELRRRAAEQAARRVPVRLLLPLVTCSLPAFALLTVVPALAGALGSLRL